MTMLSMSKHSDHIHPAWGVEQVGWLGQSGQVYALDDPPYDRREPGSFSPLYIARDEICGHAIRAAETQAGGSGERLCRACGGADDHEPGPCVGVARDADGAWMKA